MKQTVAFKPFEFKTQFSDCFFFVRKITEKKCIIYTIFLWNCSFSVVFGKKQGFDKLGQNEATVVCRLSLIAFHTITRYIDENTYPQDENPNYINFYVKWNP